MNRLQAGVAQTLTRMVDADAQKILKELENGAYWTVARFPSGKFGIIVTGNTQEIPEKWFKCPNILVENWNSWINSTNNPKLKKYLLEGYE